MLRSIAFSRRRLAEVLKRIGGRRRFKEAGDAFRRAKRDEDHAMDFSDLAKGKAKRERPMTAPAGR